MVTIPLIIARLFGSLVGHDMSWMYFLVFLLISSAMTYSYVNSTAKKIWAQRAYDN